MFREYEVECGKSIKYINVASYRSMMKRELVNAELSKFILDLIDLGVEKEGPIISATFEIVQREQEQFIDIEFLVPIDRKVDLPERYTFKPEFHIQNAISTRLVGDLHYLQFAYDSLAKYIQVNKLHQITAGYNVNWTVKSSKH